MVVMGEHAAHILELQSILRAFAAQHCFSRIVLRTRSLLTLIALLAAVPVVTCQVFAQHSTRLALADKIIVDRDIFEIDPHAIGDTKVGTTFAGGRLVYEADNQ